METALNWLIIFILGILLFTLILAILSYIALGLSFYTAAEAEGINNAFLAWIPGANYYIMYKIAGMSGHWVWTQVTLFPLVFIITFTEFFDSLLLVYLVANLLYFATSTATLVLVLMAFIKIGNKFNVNVAITILSFIIPGVIFAYYVILYKNAKKILNNKKNDIIETEHTIV